MNKITKMFLLVVIFIMASGQISTDIYVPSFPSIAHYFKVPISMVQISIVIYTIGFSIGVLLYGPLSDKYGRKKMLLIGFCISLLGSLICATAWSIKILCIGRLIQGFGFSAGNIIRAIIRDLVDDMTQLAKLGSILGVLYAFFMAIAPIIGGYIEEYAFWQLSFIILALFVLLLIYYCGYQLQETNNSKVNISINKVFLLYLHIIQNKQFLLYTLIAALSLAGITGYIAISSFLLEVQLKMLPTWFGYSYLLVSIMLLVGNFINVRLVHKYGVNNMIKLGLVWFILSGLFLLVTGLNNIINVPIILLGASNYFLASCLIFGNTSAGALAIFKDKAGTASSLYSSIQTIGAVVGSFIMSGIKYYNQALLGGLFIMSGILGLILILFCIQCKRSN